MKENNYITGTKMKSYKELVESLVTEEKFQGEEVMFRHGDFIITKRNTMGMRGKQDPYHAWIIKDGKPEVWGSHPAGVEGLKKMGRNHGLLRDGVEEIGNPNLMPIYEDQEDLEMTYDELDELNKDTLLSYYYKAGHEKTDPKKGEKRKKGTERALNKIVDKTMEEGQLVEDKSVTILSKAQKQKAFPNPKYPTMKYVKAKYKRDLAGRVVDQIPDSWSSDNAIWCEQRRDKDGPYWALFCFDIPYGRRVVGGVKMDEGTMKSDRTGQRVEAKMTSPWKKDETYIGKVVKTFTRGGSIMTHTIKLDDGKTVDVNETEIVKVLKDK